jgi:glyoxylase-like metal-dependent hydrolase (beta-lactamase superfamily II)
MTHPKIKLHVFHTGTVIVDEALPFHTKNTPALAWTGLFRSKTHQLHLPVSAYLIEHPQGLVLLDTGWHSLNRTHQLRNLSFQSLVNKADLPAGQAIDEQLARLGYQPKDLDLVLLSHLHCDHADGLRLVKEAKKIMVSEEEWQAAKKDHLHYLHHEWRGVNVETFQFKNSQLGPKGRSYDVFGDGTIQMIWVPGHCKGLAATKIQAAGSEKFVLLTSDAGYASKSWMEHISPGVADNREDASLALDWVKSQAENPNCLAALANHDAHVQPQLITL